MATIDALGMEKQARDWLIKQGIPTSGNCASLVRLLEKVSKEYGEFWIANATDPLKQELESIRSTWSEFQDLMRED